MHATPIKNPLRWLCPEALRPSLSHAGFVLALLVGTTIASAQSTLVGWATQNGGTTGGTGGTTVTVTTKSEFQNALNSSSATIIRLSGMVEGGFVVDGKSNKTIQGVNTSSGWTGFIQFKRCTNFIIKNCNLGNSGSDAITIQDSSRNFWVDHCTFTDCADGELDITNGADYVTVSWCKFQYTDESNDHRLVNLIGAGDDNGAVDSGKLRVTFHHNWWSTLCHGRMPRVRFGQVHVFNNYYSIGNHGGSCIVAAWESQLLVQNNYFHQVKDPYTTSDNGAGHPGRLRASGNTFDQTTGTIYAGNDSVFTPPYSYSLESASTARANVIAGAGNTTQTTTTPPTPSGLSATAGNAQVSLSWSSSSGATSYNIKRSTTSGSGYATIGTSSGTSFTNTGLTNGTTYYYVVSAVNSAGQSANSTQVSATPALPAPSTPSGLSATTGNAQVALSWSASSNATSYNIKRSTTSGSGYTTIGTSTGPSFTNIGLTNGTTYYYVVSAVNASGESANSSQTSATPVAAPSAPSGLTATSSNTQASLSWSAVSGATSYNVKRSTTSGSGYSTVGTATGTSFTNTGLTNGTTYYYVVSAVNSGGESANSAQASATPQPPVPSAPTSLTATSGNAQVALAWTASSGATSYNIKRSTTSGSGYATVGTASGTSFTNTGLTNGTTYYYVVSAVNDGGESANSSQASATPAIPTSTLFTYEGFNYAASLNLSAQNGGSGWNLPWSNAPINNGVATTSGLSYAGLATSGRAGQFGGNASSTVVFTRRFASTLGTSAGGGAGTVWLSLLYLNNGSTTAEARIGFYGNMVADGSGNTATSSSGLPYPFAVGRPPSTTASADQIYLYNGSTVVSSGVATPRGSIPALLLLKFNLSGNSATADTAQLWVNPNLANGEAGLGSAQATWSTSLDLEVINGIRLQNAATGQMLIDELRIGSAFSEVAPRLDAPQDFVAQAYSGQVALGWSAVAGATSYNVKRSTTSGGAYTTIATITGTEYLNTGLTNGTTYHYAVSAVSAAGESPNSAQASATPSSGGSGIPAVTLQAESGTISGGTFDSNNAGFNGTAFANLNTTGGSLQLSGINGGSSGGTATLTIRFALGASAARTGTLTINGSAQAITFPVTGAWTTWTTLTRSITLAAGSANTLQFQSTGQDLANIDEVSIAP